MRRGPVEVVLGLALEILNDTARVFLGTLRHVSVVQAKTNYGIQIDFYYCNDRIPAMQQNVYANGPNYSEMVFSSEKLAEMQNLICAWSRWNALEWWNEEGPSLTDRFRAAYGPEADVLCRAVHRDTGVDSHVCAFVYKSGDNRQIRMLLDVNEIRVFAIFFDNTKWSSDNNLDADYFRVWWPRREMCFSCSSVWAPDFLTWVQNVKKDHTIAWMDNQVESLQRTREWSSSFR